MKGGREVAEGNEMVGEPCPSERVGEIEEGVVRVIGGDGEVFEEVGGLPGVDLDVADDGVRIKRERTVADETVGEGLHNG